MSYRSEVGCLITVQNKVNSGKLLKRLEKVYGECFSSDFDVVKEYRRYTSRCIYLHADWIKWYGCFEDISAFMDFIGSWPYKTGGVHFVRIGESVDDVEEACYGDPQEFLDICRYIGIPQAS